MGLLVEGKWQDQWYGTRATVGPDLDLGILNGRG